MIGLNRVKNGQVRNCRLPTKVTFRAKKFLCKTNPSRTITDTHLEIFFYKFTKIF